MRIGVEHHHDVAVGMGQPEIDGASFASVLGGDQGHSLIVCKTCVHDVGRAVRRAVVDDNDAELAVRARQDLPDRGGDHLCFIVGRDQDRNREFVRIGGNTPPVRPRTAHQRETAKGRQPCQAEPDGSEEQGRHRPLQPAVRKKDITVDDRRSLIRRDGRHGLILRPSRQFRRRHEVEALGPHRIDQLGQRGDGGGAIAACIMQQHNLTPLFEIGVCRLGHNAFDDLLRRRLLPIVGIDLEPNGQVAQFLGFLQGRDFLGAGRLRITKIGWPEKPRGPPRQSFDQALGRVDLDACDAVRGLAEIGVCERMVAEIVPFGEHSLNKSRIGGAVLADNEEGRVDALLLEDVQDLGVQSGLGPSSNVSAILPGISPVRRTTKEAGIFV